MFLSNQGKNCISTTTMPMATKCGRIVTYYGRLPPIKVVTLSSCGLSKPCDKSKTHLHYQGTCGHQTWQEYNVPWGPFAHKVTWYFDLVILDDHVTNYNNYTSPTKVPMTTKLGSIVTYLEGLLLIKPHDAMIRWSREITLQTKIIISPTPQCLWPPNVAGCLLILSSSHR